MRAKTREVHLHLRRRLVLGVVWSRWERRKAQRRKRNVGGDAGGEDGDANAAGDVVNRRVDILVYIENKQKSAIIIIIFIDHTHTHTHP
jgi:hypothetical protein